VFFHGDIFVGAGKTSPDYLGSSQTRQQQEAERWSKRLGLPYIAIGRPGTYGSSGDHMQRRRPAESALVSAMLDRLKERHGIEEFVLAGQSGGGHLTSALLTLRADIVCAVPTSAPSSPRIRWEMMGRSRDTTMYTDSYEPWRHVDAGRMHPRLRVFVLGDPHDNNVFWASQTVMADALADAGIAVQVLHGEGSGPESHGLSNSARRVASWCAKGMATRDMLHEAAKGLRG
jgi:pimeloyl-ACP methyl ester carboxylesterase